MKTPQNESDQPEMNELVIDATEPAKPDIVPIAAVRLQTTPNRHTRNTVLTELGTMMTDQGVLRLYANRADGSLVFVMPDGKTSYSISSGVAASQCYKYWLLTSGGTPDADTPTEASDEVELFDQFGRPITPAQA